MTGLFFVVLLLLKYPVLLRQGAERSTFHDAPIIGVIGSVFFQIPVLLHLFVLLRFSQSTYEHYIMLRDEMDESESLVVYFRELFWNMQRAGLTGNIKGPNLDTLPHT